MNQLSDSKYSAGDTLGDQNADFSNSFEHG